MKQNVLTMRLGVLFLLISDQENCCISVRLQMYWPAQQVPNRDQASSQYYGVQYFAVGAQLMWRVVPFDLCAWVSPLDQVF